jgi:hypothetical protein
MKNIFYKQVIILALFVSLVGVIHFWNLPNNLLVATLDRKPASETPIMNLIGLVDPEEAKVVDVETRHLDCQNISDLYVKNLSLRLEGNCAYELGSVTNKTNGYTASVFNRDKAFTTDYISLSEGKNLIEITYKDDKNQDVTSQLPIIVTK